MDRGAATLARIARALQAESRWANSPLPALWFLTDETRMADAVAAAQALPPGTGVVLRHYGDPERGALARRLAGLARARGLVLFVAADAALARAAGAAGVHLPRWAPAIHLCTDLLVTASVHGLADVARRSADAYLAGPVFATPSHPEGEPLGPLRLAAIARAARVPVIALGGISARNARRLMGTGVAGLAAIGALLPEKLRI